MVKVFPYSFLLLLFSTAILSSQTEDLSGRQSELDQLKSDIKNLEEQLKSKTKKEKQSLESLQLYTQQGLFLNKLINSIRKDESQKETEIKHTRKNISDIEEEIHTMRKMYSKYIVYLYKYGQTDNLNYLVNTKSLNQAILRNRYLNRLTNRNQVNLSKLGKAKNELLDLNKKLIAELEEKRKLEEQKKAEESSLAVRISERRNLVRELKDNKNVLRKEIELKRKSETEIKNLIAKLIEEERKKAEIQRKAEELKKQQELAAGKNIPVKETIENKLPNKKSDNSVSDFVASSFVRGKLLWPVENGKIIRKFGEYRNERLNTITLNYGVDIKTTRDLTVKAVAGGVVSSVTWLPGYGSIIILTHKDNFRTVYGHLGEIYVSEGTQVFPGKIIGTIAEGLEGNILHFEIWSERVNQNPELWLVKK